MARHRRYAMRGHRHHSNKFTLPMAPIGGLAVGLYNPISQLTKGNFRAAAEYAVWEYAGIADPYMNPHFDWNGLMHGTVPLLAGVVIHKIAGRLGVNKVLARSGVPVFRV